MNPEKRNMGDVMGIIHKDKYHGNGIYESSVVTKLKYIMNVLRSINIYIYIYIYIHIYRV